MGWMSSARTKYFWYTDLVRQSRAWVSQLRNGNLATATVDASNVNPFATYDNRNATKPKSLIDSVLPRSRFGSSIFTTPLLLFFRFFYHAAPFDKDGVQSVISPPRANVSRMHRKSSSELCTSTSDNPVVSLAMSGTDGVPGIASKTSTDAWHLLLQSKDYPIRLTSTLHSMTWVKSLSAPLSHEYLQVVIDCSDSGKRYRLITERDTNGDWAYLIASSGECGQSQQSNNIAQLRQYDYQHDLPLPLLSVSWAWVPLRKRPTTVQLASVLEQTSKMNPKYNIKREHCWWYAETVFERMFLVSSNELPPGEHRGPGRANNGQPDLKHWPAGAYRYSYILLGKRILRREMLVQQAKKFRHEMDGDGQLHW